MHARLDVTAAEVAPDQRREALNPLAPEAAA